MFVGGSSMPNKDVYVNEYLISNLYLINMSINNFQQTVKNFEYRLNRFSK